MSYLCFRFYLLSEIVVTSVCGKTPFYDGFKSLDGIRRSGDHVDLGDVRRVIGPSGLQKCG